MSKEIFSDIENILRGLTGKNLEIGIITAENEMGRELPDAVNNRRNEELYKELNNISGANVYRIQGNFGGMDENSFLVTGVSLRRLKDLASKYKQQAFIYGTGKDDNMMFHYMEAKDNNSDNLDYESVQIRKTFVYKPYAKENFSSYKGIKFVIPFFDSHYNDLRWEDLSSEEKGEDYEEGSEPEESKLSKIKKLIGNSNVDKDESHNDFYHTVLRIKNNTETPENVKKEASLLISDMKTAGGVNIIRRELENFISKYNKYANNESYIKRISKIVESLKIKEEKVKIKVKHSDLLEVPKGKNFWSLPFSHYKKLVDKKGYSKVIRALNNLKVWNKEDDPDISDKADKIMDRLKKEYRPETNEEVRQFQKVILELPKDDKRPEDMRVVKTRLQGRDFYLVQSNPRGDRWITQAEHNDRNEAIKDAESWY